MRLPMTVHLPRRRACRVDVDVVGTSAHTVADLRAALATHLGEAVGHLTCGGARVPDDCRLGAPPLLHGAHLVVDGPASAHAVPAPVELVVRSGPDAGHAHALADALVLGRGESADLRVADPDLSREHARLTVGDSDVWLTDLGSTNGIDLEAHGERQTRVSLTVGDVVRAGSSRLALVRTSPLHAPSTPIGDGTVEVNRAPRVTPAAPATTVDAPTPPTPPHRVRIPWVVALIPVPVAGLMAWFFGPQLLAFALLGPLMMLGTALSDRMGSRRQHRRAQAAYESDLAARTADLEAALDRERVLLERDHPDPSEVLAIASRPLPRLWERTPGEPVWCSLRLGTGTVTAATGWRPSAGALTHPPLAHAPVVADLGGLGALGLVADPARLVAWTRQIVGQLAALHPPSRLRLWVLAHGDEWHWAATLPHTRASTVGRSPVGADALLAELCVAVRSAHDESPPGRHPPLCDVLVVPDAGAMPPLPKALAASLADPASCLCLVVGAAVRAALPSVCRAVLAYDPAGTGATLTRDGLETVRLVPDGVGAWWAARLAASLAPLRDRDAATEEVLPTRLRLRDIVSADSAQAVAAQWGRSTGAPLAVLGRTPAGAWTVDLRTDGPHVLVGGTTGSGKSELLQTLVASLALSLPPEELTFVLVDYKGGAAFGRCVDLPHTVGLVTDLDEHLAARALTSLTAEVTRRERLFADAGATSLEDYRSLDGVERVPRLVIVLDEFRLLAQDVPDFLAGVVHLAAVGRSLGLHVVLATQRPAGAVGADIQANVNLRIALRVRDKADSRDVIECDDAARVPPHLPGRGIFRTGGGAATWFQAARVAGPRPSAGPDAAPLLVLAPGEPTPADPVEDDESDLDDLVRLVRAAHELRGGAPPRRPWHEPLPDALALPLCEPGPGSRTEARGDAPAVRVGALDSPATQEVHPLTWAPGAGPWLVVGGPRSGRTSALRTLAAAAASRWPPSELHVHAVAGPGLGDLAALPHTGTVAAPTAPRLVARLLARLAEEVSRRPSTPSPQSLPAVLVLVDDLPQVQRLCEADDTGETMRSLMTIATEGPGVGVSLVVTGDRSALLGRLPGVCETCLVLRLNDPQDAALAGLSRSETPRHWPAGRAVRSSDRLEAQIAHVGSSPDLADQRAAVSALAATTPPPPAARAPLRLRELPRTVAWGDLSVLPPTRERLPIGLGGDECTPVVLDLTRHGRRLSVLGPGGSGRTTTLATLAHALTATGRPTCVVTSCLDALSGPTTGHVLAPDDLDGLVELRRAARDLAVLVDDAEVLAGQPIEPVLCEIARLAERDDGLVVVATSPAALLARFTGLAVEVARSGTGLLLMPGGPADGDALGIRAPRGLDPRPGHGLLVHRRATTEVQLAHP